MNRQRTWLCAALVLTYSLGTTRDAQAFDQDATAPARPKWWTEAVEALDAGQPDRTLQLLDRPSDPAQALLAARAHYAAGDLVGTTVAAARGLPSAGTGERRELLWWGSNAALGIGDAAAASAWTLQLSASVGEDQGWREAADQFSALAADLDARHQESTDAVNRARTVSIVGLIALALIGAAALRRRP